MSHYLVSVHVLHGASVKSMQFTVDALTADDAASAAEATVLECNPQFDDAFADRVLLLRPAYAAA